MLESQLIHTSALTASADTKYQILVALVFSLASSTVALAVRFEGNGRIFQSWQTRGLGTAIIIVSTFGAAATTVALPLLGKLHPAAFLPLAAVMPSGLAATGRGAKRRSGGEENSTLSNITNLLTLGISYLLRRLEDQIAADGFNWASSQIKNWREDGIVGAADYYHERLCSRFSSNGPRCKEVDAIRDRIEDKVRAAELTAENRKKIRSVGEARIDLRLLLQRAYMWGCASIPPYSGSQRSIISDGDTEYEVFASYHLGQAGDEVRPEDVTAKQLLDIALDLNRASQDGSDTDIGDRLSRLYENLPLIMKEIDERRGHQAGEGGSGL